MAENKVIINKNLKRTFVGLSDDSVPVEIFYGEGDIGVVIFPPDPEWGGTMYNALVTSIFDACRKNKISVMRLTFIKHTKFGNCYNRYITQASVCVEEFMKEVGWKGKLWLVGYSFGAYFALNILMRRPEVYGFIMIAPPFLHYDFISWINAANTRGLIVYGTKDDLTPENLVREYAQCLLSKKMQVKILPVFGANHTFTGKTSQMATEIVNFIKKT